MAMKWIDEIVSAMDALGGAARYADLYQLIEASTDRNLTREWKATVRRTIEDHSSDSANFRGEDIFQHVSHGHWQLRGREVDEAELAKRETLTPIEVMARVLVREHWRSKPTKPDRSGDGPVRAHCDESRLHVELGDGREISTPLWWYPSLLRASHSQRNTMELMLSGIHWPELDEDLSVDGMLRGWKHPDADEPGLAAK
jgi:hypothetical protein